MLTYRYILSSLLLLLTFSLAEAQVGVTPYSSQGLGNLSKPALAHNIAMGGVGLANGTGLHINNINPALLYQNTLSSFDAAFTIDYKDMSKSSETASGWNGGFAYGILAFPVINNRWSMSVGLSPYSQVQYSIEETRNIDNRNEVATLNQEGRGGLSQVHFSNGVRLFKGLSVGLKASYLFGAINEDLSILPESEGDAGLVTSYVDNIYYRGLVLEPALHYSLKLGESTSLNFGAVYQPKASISATRNVNFENLDAGGQLIGNDTIAFNEEGDAIIPQKLGLGLAFDKYLNYTIAFDFTVQSWEEFGAYQAEEGVGIRSNDGMQNAYTFALGGSIIPDVTSVSSYLKRVTYRAGLRYEATPFYVNGTQINDMSLSLGFTLPMSNLSSMNLALQAGISGTTDNNLVRENYYKATLGISFNDRWFIRRKFD